MSDKIAFVLNEKGNLVPLMITIETRDDTDYIMERELLFLTDLEFPCPDANGFAQGVSVGYTVKALDDAKAQQAKVGVKSPRDVKTGM